MACKLKIEIGSTNRLRLFGLVNGKDKTPLGAASVTAKLMDVQRTLIETITMVLDDAAGASFEGYISDEANVVPNKPYIVEVKVDGGTNLKKIFEVEAYAEKAKGC